MKWISWFQPTDDHRPLTYPPSEKIIAWWCTDYNDKGAVLVSLVDVDDQQQAEHHVKLNWPEVKEWRFCEDKDNKSFGDRYPLSDWMIDRGCTYKAVIK